MKHGNTRLATNRTTYTDVIKKPVESMRKQIRTNLFALYLNSSKIISAVTLF